MEQSDKDAHRKEKITVFADKSLGGSEATECSTDYNEDAEYQSFSVKQSSVDSNQPDLRVLDRILSKAGDDFCDDEKDDGNVDDIDLDTFRKKCLEDPESLESMVCAAGNDDEEDEDTIVVPIPDLQMKSDLPIKEKSKSGKSDKKKKKKVKKEKRSKDAAGDEDNCSESGAKRKKLFSFSFKNPFDSSNADKSDNKENNKKLKDFASNTSDQLMNVVKEEVKSKYKQWPTRNDASNNNNDNNDENELDKQTDGIFKVRAPLITADNRDKIVSQESTDVDQSSAIDIPTITINEDQLDDSSVLLSEATLKNDDSDDDFTDIQSDQVTLNSLKSKPDNFKSKMKLFGEKVKDIFQQHPKNIKEGTHSDDAVAEYIDNVEERRKRLIEKEAEEMRIKEEEKEAQRRKKELELERKAKELELAAAAEEKERVKKELKKRAKEEEEKRKKEEERQKKEQERIKKEEEKSKKEQEKLRKLEEQRVKVEEEKKRKEEEKKKKEEEKRIKAEENKKRLEEERKLKESEKQKKEEEKREREILEKQKKEEELLVKKKEEEARQRLAIEERKIEVERIKLEEMAKKMLEEDESKMPKRDDDKDFEPKIAFTTSQENKKSISSSAKSIADELKKTLSKLSNFNDDKKNTSSLSSPQEEAIVRRASSPTPMVHEDEAKVSVVFSQQALIVKQDELVEDKKLSQEKEETYTIEDDQLDEAVESDGEGNANQMKRKKMRKKLKDTKEKLISLKTKAIKSVPSFTQIKSKVKELLSTDDDDSKIIKKREQKLFKDYKERYPDSDAEFVSDSELVGSRKVSSRKWGKKMDHHHHSITHDDDAHYEQQDSQTTSRMDILFSPISGPLRPPRKSDFSNFQSVPNICKHEESSRPGRVKRKPPPRPPPPMVKTSESIMSIASTMDEVNLDLDKLDQAFRHDNNYISRTQSTERIPANVFYKKVVQDWQERNIRRLDEISQSSPNLCHVPYLSRPPRPGRLQSFRMNRDYPRAPVRRSHTMLSRRVCEMPLQEVNTTSTDTLPPLPPPRSRSRFASNRSLASSRSTLIAHHRKIEPSYFDPTTDKADLATDGLYWKPFSWKSGRCRSLTEIYVRKCAPSQSEVPVEKTLSYKLTSKYCAPPRPPPIDFRNEEAIYSTIHRYNQFKRPSDMESVFEDAFETNSNNDNYYMQRRPLPTPPLPPRSRRRQKLASKLGSSPATARSNHTNYYRDHEPHTFIRSVSPFGIPVRDVCVNTSSENISKMAEKEVQTSFENVSEEECKSSDSPTPKVAVNTKDKPSLAGKSTQQQSTNNSRLDGELNLVAGSVNNQCKTNNQIADDQSKTSASVYYDAEGCDTDMDVFGELDSYSDATITSSQFHSLADQSNSTARSNRETMDEARNGSTGLLVPNRSSGARNSLDQNAILNSSQFTPRDINLVESSSVNDGDSEDDLMETGRTSQTEIRACIQRRTIGGRSGSFSDGEWG